MNGQKVKMVFAGVAAVALVVFVFAAGYRTAGGQASASPAATAPAMPAAAQQTVDPLIALRSKGDTAAPLTIYELSDFQCPFCKIFYDSTMTALVEEYVDTGKARLVFINLPLASLHPNAPAAHEVAMCAGKQGKFWQVHNLLFEHQRTWAPMSDPSPFLVGLADSVGIDQAAFNQCIAQGEVRQLIASDVNQARMARVTSTPTFVIEGGLLPGAQPIQLFRTILDSIYAERMATPAN